jgi:glyoxylase-like metal-dependent hydrolase (beta-lactamase superfamily II)
MPALISLTPLVAIRRVAVGSMDNNVYLLTAAETGHQILIDAADEMSRIEALLRAAAKDADQPVLRAIITTHAHQDHLRALGALATASGAMVLVGAEDLEAVQRLTGVRAPRGLHHGDRVTAPPLSLDVIALRGHTPGSIALAYREVGQPTHLFTGDSLFPGGVGNTDRDPERFKRLLGDVERRLFANFGDSTIVHPGHGAPTTLGAERPHLDEWRSRGW